METVTTSPLDGYQALLMQWSAEPAPRDVHAAFQGMTGYLQAAPAPVRVVVDVSMGPRFPLSETIQGAFWGPFRHEKLAEWLVVGASRTAQLIGHSLTTLSRRDNIRWFDTLEQAMAYLAAAEADTGGQAPL